MNWMLQDKIEISQGRIQGSKFSRRRASSHRGHAKDAERKSGYISIGLDPRRARG